MRKLFGILLVTLGLAACSASQDLGPNTYKVQGLPGNVMTQAAQMADSKGFSHFVVVERWEDTPVRTYQGPNNLIPNPGVAQATTETMVIRLTATPETGAVAVKDVLGQ